MGYPLQSNAPQDVINGNTYAVGAFEWSTPVGNIWVCSIFQNLNGGWNNVDGAPGGFIAEYQADPAGAMLADVTAKGGIGPYVQWVAQQVNAAFLTLGITTNFTIPTNLSLTTPFDDASSMTALQTAVAAGKFASAGIPAKMQSDFTAGFAGIAQFSIGADVGPWAGGRLTKVGQNVLQFTDPSGGTFMLIPETDLNAFAKTNKFAAAQYLSLYGFTPE